MRSIIDCRCGILCDWTIQSGGIGESSICYRGVVRKIGIGED